MFAGGLEGASAEDRRARTGGFGAVLKSILRFPFLGHFGCTKGPGQRRPASHQWQIFAPQISAGLASSSRQISKMHWKGEPKTGIGLPSTVARKCNIDFGREWKKVAEQSSIRNPGIKWRNYLVTQPELVVTKGHFATQPLRQTWTTPWHRPDPKSWRPESINLPSLHCSNRLRSAKTACRETALTGQWTADSGQQLCRRCPSLPPTNRSKF